MLYLHASFITCTDEFIKWLEYKQFSNMLNRKSQYNIAYFIKSQFVFTSLKYNVLNCVMHMQFLGSFAFFTARASSTSLL